jgi:hypothetical protein
MQTDNEYEEVDLEAEELKEGFIPILSNEVTKFKLDILQAIYDSVVHGQLGYLDAKDPETGEIVPLLVGIEFNTDGTFKPYPIAKFISGKDVFKDYLVPDGKGGYVSGADTGASEEEGGETQGLHKEQTN